MNLKITYVLFFERKLGRITESNYLEGSLASPFFSDQFLCF